MENNSFVHLHVHSEYSLLDGACRIKELVKRVKTLGQTAVALTDHGVMYGAVDFYREAKAEGIKPVIGCEVYVAPRSRYDRDMRYDSHPYHLILLCRNNEGYRNLIRLVSLGFTEGFYSKPRVDLELLKRYSEGLICLSGCIAGEIAVKLLNDEYDNAKNTALTYKEIFGDENYYLEVQNHGISNQRKILPLLYKLSAETGIPLAATNDAHYTEKDDAETQDILMCIQLKSTLAESDRLKFPNDEFYIKSTQEMSELFRAVPEAVTNTVSIAERCNVEFKFGDIKLPEFVAEGALDNIKYFRQLCAEGLIKRYGNSINDSIKERLDYEISIIIEMGYIDYFLIVWDFIRYAKEHNIPVGPGRGSGVGSLCAYCIGITGIDPIKYDLLFERFLNPERKNMPDFDIDFCIEGRQQVIDYVVEKYGADKVSQIMAFDTLKARAAVKDTARALGMEYSASNEISGMIPKEPDITIEKALEKNKDLKKRYDTNQSVHRLIDAALKIEGMPRNVSVHAAGVVISTVPLTELVPVRTSSDAVITQYTMSNLEDLGLLKIDFLGLRNLTVIKHCTDQINAPEFDINSIPLNDREVFKMMSAGRTTGVFQFESDGMRRVLRQLKPESLEDLIAVISLYRPGPSESIPKYIKNKHDPKGIVYKHPVLESILSVTYGCMVYQEQVMEICRKAAGYSYGRADIVRRAMAKKKHDIMEKERQVFLYGSGGKDGCPGAVANGIDEETANDIFDEMSSFASYAFNKSHAAAYAYLSYQTAFLKCHYTAEYMAALMTSVIGNTDKLKEYVEECRKSGINILIPDVNCSFGGFRSEEAGIRFGLLAIKSIGNGVIDEIVSEREKSGRYTSLENFCKRTAYVNIGKITVENMIKSGCFDSLGATRHEMLSDYEGVMNDCSNFLRNNIEGQMSLFQDDTTIGSTGKKIHLKEFEYSDMLALEKEAAGMYISGHPLDCCRLAGELMKLPCIADVRKCRDKNTELLFLGLTNDVKIHYTSKGEKMAFAEVEDLTGKVSCTVFPDSYELFKNKLISGKILYITGKVSQRNNYEFSIICNNILSEDEFMDIAGKKRLCIKLDSSKPGDFQRITEIASYFPGNNPICFYLTDVKRFIRPKTDNSVKVCSEFINEISSIAGRRNIGLID